MKTTLLILFPLVLLVTATGCAHRNASANSESPSSTQTRTVSSDGYTWKLGAVTVDGTNVPLSSVEVKPATNAGK